MHPAPVIALPVLLAAAACGGAQLQASTLHPGAAPRTAAIHRPGAAHPHARHPAAATTVKAAADRQQTGAFATSMCSTGGLSLHLGQPGDAAGSRYQPIVFTNTTETTCTLAGYPGVSFVAPGTGHQVGAAASRNAQHPTATIALAPGASASALLQIADYANYPSAGCNAARVSGLRVYPPGNTAAAYIPFRDGRHNACSSDDQQLAVDAVVAGASG